VKNQVVICILAASVLLNSPEAVRCEPERDHMTAFFLSFAVPGLGQWYAGSPGSGKTFIAAELMLWGGFFYTSLLKNSFASDYLRFASVHAHVNPEGYGTAYLAVLGAYDSSFEYNRSQEQRSSNPVTYDGAQSWNWDSYENRDRFKQLRERELDFENYGKYCVAGIVLNHFLAGINASKLVRQTTLKTSQAAVIPIPNGLSAYYSWRF
jgi:hypothetical protein